MFRRRSLRSSRTYLAWAVVSAAIGVLDLVVGLGVIDAVIVFLFSAWSLNLAWRARAGR